MLEKLDSILTGIIRSLERFYESLGRIGDYVLDFLSRTFQALLRILKRAISTIYRFLHDLLANLLKITWNLLKLALVPLFVWGFGDEVRRVSFWALGWFIEIVALAGFGLFVVAVLASFARSGAEEDSPVQSHSHLPVAFFVLNLLALCTVLIVSWYGRTGLGTRC